jgi:hypothetical protein
VRQRVQEKLDSANAVVADLVSALGVMDGAGGRLDPERARETWTVDQLREWLSTTRTRDGATLESKLEGKALDAQVQKYVRGYAEGARGFELDTAKIRFPSDPPTLGRLRGGIECGAITGIVIEAYPDAAQLQEIAQRVTTNPTAEVQRLLRETGLEFLVNHFQARGGTVYTTERSIAVRRMLKWPRAGKPLWKAFHDRATLSGHGFVTGYNLTANGTRSPQYRRDHAAIYAGLDPQPSVQELLGTVSVVFTNTRRDVPTRSKILGVNGIARLTQGERLSFIALLEHKVDTLSPAEYLALTTAISRPADMTTYPNPDRWTWLAGMDPQDAAAVDLLAGELCLASEDPEYSDCRTRIRSVIR